MYNITVFGSSFDPWMDDNNDIFFWWLVGKNYSMGWKPGLRFYKEHLLNSETSKELYKQINNHRHLKTQLTIVMNNIRHYC